MEAIWSSVLLLHHVHPLQSSGEAPQLSIPAAAQKSKVARKLTMDDSSLQEAECASVGSGESTRQSLAGSSLYQQEVSKRIAEAKDHLSAIFPLNYRLEVLEDIFSLLFLTTEDILKSEKGFPLADSLQSSASRSSSGEGEPLSSTRHSLAFICKQHGFLVTEQIAGDILELLDNCRLELSAAKYSLLSGSMRLEESSLLSGVAIHSSISPGSLQQRVAKLQKQINEAKWRLQLVSAQQGLVADQTKPSLDSLSDEVTSGDESSSNVSDGDENDNDGSHLQVRPKTLMAHEVQHSSDSSSGKRKSSSPMVFRSTKSVPSRQSTMEAKRGQRMDREKHAVHPVTSPEPYEKSGHCADIEDRTPVRKPKVGLTRKKRLRSQGSVSSRWMKGTSSLMLGSKSIVCQMLASPESLLYRCLKHANYSKAKEVLKMFSLEGQLGDGLVQFLEQFELVSRDLATRSLSSSPHHSSPLQPIRQTRSNRSSRGGSLQAVIQNTTGDSPALEGLHRLLTPTTICDMLFAGNSELEKHSQDPLLLALRENVPALTMLDVLISTRMEGLTAKKIIDMAASRSKTAIDMLPDTKLDGSFPVRRGLERRSIGSDRFIQGPLGLLHMFSEVSGYFIHPSSQLDIISSPHLLLTKFPLSLKVNLIMNWKGFCDNYFDAREQLEDAICSSPVQQDVLELVNQQSTSNVVCKEELVFDNVAQALLMFPVERGHPNQELLLDGGDERESHYLWRLGVYLTKFVYLLMRCMGLDMSGGVAPSQTLSVLKDSPTKLIGRLVFEKSISPQKLKQFMDDFPHLKVVEVIVKCCCPLVPSASSFTQTPLLVTRDSVLVLNYFPDKENTGEGSDDPCDLSHKLLSKVLSTIKGVCQTEDGFINPRDLLVASKTTEMKKVLSCTSQLASVSLSTLQGSTSRQLAFLCNVVNLLYMHAIITFLQYERDGETSKLFGGSHISLSVLQSDLLVQTALFSRLGYHIGELGVVSCFDLHHTILRHGLSFPVLDKKHLLKPRTNMVDSDPWACHAPSQPDPRVLYVICTGIRSSPLPRLLQPEHTHSELDAAEAKFIRATVHFDPSKHEISIPKVLEDHCNDFIPRRCQYSPGNPYHSISSIALARYILHKLPKEQAVELSEMIDACDSSRQRKCTASIKVLVQEMDLRLGYYFPKTRKRGDVSFKESSPPFPRSSYRTKKQMSRTYETIKPYSFTEDTVAFVREQAPILASLVCLLCPPEMPSSQAPNFKPPSSERDSFQHDVPEQHPAPAIVQTLPPDRKEQPKPSLVRHSSCRSITSSDEEKVVITHPSPVWQDTLDALLSHLPEDNALRRFLLDRLLPFKGILPWEKLIHDSEANGDGNGDGGRAGSHGPTINLRWLTVLPSQSPELGHACGIVMRKLLQRGMVKETLKFLQSEPVANNGSHVQFAVDLVVSSALSRVIGDERERNHCLTLEPLALVYQLSDPELAMRLVLPALVHWPVTTCVGLLFFCFHHLPTTSSFINIVQEYLKKLQVCEKVMNVTDNPIGRHSKCPWVNWSQLDKDTREKPAYVLSLLLDNRAFSLAREWASVYDLEYSCIEQIEEEYVHELLEGSDSPDPYTAQGVLEDLPSDDIKMKVCNSILDHCQKLETEVLLLHFMLSKLSDQICPTTKIQELKNRLMGAKCLLTLPSFIQQQYRPLIAEPLLIVEQLLMDLKIDWAATVIKLLSEDKHFADIDTKEKLNSDHLPAVLQGQEEAHNPFTTLLMFYAKKALEFPLLSSQAIPCDATGTSLSTRAPSPTVPVTPAPHRPLERLRSPTEPPSAAPTVPATPHHRLMSTLISPPAESINYNVFVPPPEPPTKDKWEPDSKARSCRVCKTVYFSMFSRRHHCRRCGRIVCGPCSGHFMIVRGYDTQQRVCKDCHSYHLLRSGSSEEPVTSQDDVDLSSAFPGLSAGLQWVLMPRDQLYNQNQRTEFFYEQSPSTHLCLAIVDLISDTRVGAGFILHCVHEVSQQLVPDSQGKVNEEIDHYFTIGIIQSLLLNSKLRYSYAGDSSGVELCDTYLSRVDLLRLMVSARYKEIPSIQELTKHELARRVRDKLIADDRFELAMEVTTKCQLDTIAVWSAWGMASLRCGDFQLARDKFKHCFQLTSQHNPGYSNHLLELIIEQLLSCPLVLVKIHDWSSMLKNAVQLTERRQEGLPLDDLRFNECCYYLRCYSSSGKMVAFLARNNCWSDACSNVLDKKCSPDVFVECLWVPAVRSGHLEQLEEYMKTVDPTLVTWEPYLNCVCRYLSQRGLYHILYHTQLFMRDYIRSGMTCIKFFMGFQGRATTMNDLYSRRRFLNTAKQHFLQAINDKHHQHSDTGRRGSRMAGGGVRPVDESSRLSLTLTKNMSPEDLQNHIRTINLQEKVIELQYQACVATNTLYRPVPMASVSGDSGLGQQQPATLFGNGQVRGELVCHLLTSSQEVDFSEKFRLGLDIVSTFRLPPGRVFAGVAKQLAAKESYSQVRQLLQELLKSRLHSQALNDEVCMAAIKVLASQPKETAQKDGNLEKLVQMLHTDRHKIQALMQCGKLKNAYLIAIRANYPDEVQQIADAATKANQATVKSFCERWLQQNRAKR